MLTITVESSVRDRFKLLPAEQLTDEQCRVIANRFTAYRLPEREQLGNVPRDKALDPLPVNGKSMQPCVRVSFKRRVARVGYRFEHEVPDEQLNNLCRSVVARNAGLTEEQVQTVLNMLDRKNPYRSARYHIGPQLRSRLIAWFDRQPDAHTASFKINNALITDLRTLWYLDAEPSSDWYRRNALKSGWPEPDAWTGWLVGHRQVRCGLWYPASGGYDSWTGDSDYESAGLHPAYNQTLLKIDLQGERLPRRPWPDTWSDSVMAEYDYHAWVHPSDITVLDDGQRWGR